MVQIGFDIFKRSIRDVNKILLRGETTVKKLHENSTRLIRETAKLNPFITVCHEESSKRARDLDLELLERKASYRGPKDNLLFGIPISIKDNFCTDRVLTTCASRMLQNFVPNYTATAVSKLLDANCIMMGKTNMDEFAMGSSSVSSFYGPTANSWQSNSLDCKPTLDLEISTERSKDENGVWFMAGGSSTGSAISVASGACFASLGTDTGGSTRQPGSLTGVVGFKPTYGLISRFGLVPLVHCLDTVSIIARRVDDARIVFNTIIGQDENDLTSVDCSTIRKNNFLEQRHVGGKKLKIRVGIPDQFISDGKVTDDVSEGFGQALKLLNKSYAFRGIIVEFVMTSINLSYSNLATECYTIISSTEISSNMSCFDGLKYGFATRPDGSDHFDRDKFYRTNRDEGFGAEVKKRILLGNYFLLSGNKERYLVQATKLRRCIYDEFNKEFTNVDIIMTPSTPSPSVSYKEWARKRDDDLLFHEDYFLIPANLAALPSINVPYGFSSRGMPLGLQVIADRFHDLDLLFVSEIIENIFKR